MGGAIKKEVTVGAKGDIRLTVPEFQEGTRVVITLIQASAGEHKKTAKDYFGKIKGLHGDEETIMRHLREERDRWDARPAQ